MPNKTLRRQYEFARGDTEPTDTNRLPRRTLTTTHLKVSDGVTGAVGEPLRLPGPNLTQVANLTHGVRRYSREPENAPGPDLDTAT